MIVRYQEGFHHKNKPAHRAFGGIGYMEFNKPSAFCFLCLNVMKNACFILAFLLTACVGVHAQQDVLLAENGIIKGASEAPLELIRFQSSALKGVIHPQTKSFAFKVSVSSFQGFNSEIQRVHFMENYMEQKKYPEATFSGKVIEDIPFDTPGTYTVRAKGELEIHGVKKERIIKGTITISEGVAHIRSDFTIPVADHGITIPRIVKQKIAEEISVFVEMVFALPAKS